MHFVVFCSNLATTEGITRHYDAPFRHPRQQYTTPFGVFDYAAAYLFTSNAIFQGGTQSKVNNVSAALAYNFFNGGFSTFRDPTEYMIN